MPIFDYVANDPQTGRQQQGTIEAPNREVAINKLREEKYTVLAVEPQKVPTNVDDIIARFMPIKLQVLVYFSRQFATMIGSGMSTLRSLSVLQEAETNPKFKDILTDIVANIEAGVPIYVAMRKHPDVFDRLYTAMVRSGEESGTLDEALRVLANDLEERQKLRRAIKSATIYPKVVIGFSFIIVSGLLVILVPRFAKIFEEAVRTTNAPGPGGQLPSADLPGLTQFMLDASHLIYPETDAKGILWFIQVFGRMGIAFALILLLRYGVRRMLKEPGPRRAWDSFKLKAPMKIGILVQKIAVARFSRTFASLLSAGVSTVEAMDIVSETSGNMVVEEAVIAAREQVMAGSAMSETLARSGAFPVIVTRMIEVGEETGQLELMLTKVAEFFEDEVAQAIKGLTSLIEPLMIIIVGSAIGLIIISIYLPMFALYDKIGTGVVVGGPVLAVIAAFYRKQFSKIRAGWAAYQGKGFEDRLEAFSKTKF